MNLDVIAPYAEHIVNVNLLRPGVVTDSLEFDEEGVAAWDQENPIGPTGLTCRGELQAFDAKVIQGLPNNLGLNVSFKMPHGAVGCG